MADDRITLRLPDGGLAAIDGARGETSRSAWILGLIERELTGETAAVVPAAPSAAGGGALSLGAGVPSPGVLCMQPACFQRDTARYGLHGLPLCPACAAALEGREYHRPLTAQQRRSLSRSAA